MSLFLPRLPVLSLGLFLLCLLTLGLGLNLLVWLNLILALMELEYSLLLSMLVIFLLMMNLLYHPLLPLTFPVWISSWFRLIRHCLPSISKHRYKLDLWDYLSSPLPLDPVKILSELSSSPLFQLFLSVWSLTPQTSILTSLPLPIDQCGMCAAGVVYEEVCSSRIHPQDWSFLFKIPEPPVHTPRFTRHL